jgi:hypothetical protein
MSQSYQPLQGVFTEKEVGEFLGLTKGQLTRLRFQGLPFVKVNQRARFYLEDDVMDWLRSKRTVLNRASNDA